MGNDITSSHQIRSSVVRDTFDKLDLNESVCLVGIMYDTRMVFKDSQWTLQPLQPGEAARLTAALYGQSEQRLLQRFHQNWGSLRTSETTDRLVSQLQQHRLVDRIEYCSSKQS